MEHNEQRFEAYFNGTLSEDDVQKFNDELASDPDFNTSYQYFLSIKEGTALNFRDELRSKLDDVNIQGFAQTDVSSDQSTFPSNSKSNRSYFKWILGLVFLALLAYFSYSYFSSSSPAALYASNFELYEAQNVRGGSSDELKSLYTKGDYENFVDMASTVEMNPELLMMLANAHLKLENYEKAHSVLLDISDESSLRDLKYWNLGLVSLKLNHLPQAQNHFKYLQSVSNYKKAKIKKILSKISK